MDELPLAPTTEKAVKAYLKSPSAVLILHGPAGVGKRQLASRILANILQIVQDKLITYPYLVSLEPEKDSISIDQVRSLQSALIRSVPGDQPIRRAVLIQDAHKMTTEAQNALLKSLEEAPVDTVFVLCVDNLNSLLTTVTSRAQPLAVLPISETDAKEHFGDTPETVKAFHMSGGRADLMRAILQDEDHPLLANINQAKEVLQKTTYDRLLLVNNLSKDKPATEELLEALLLLARISLTTSVKNEKTDQAKRWHKIIKQVGAAQKSLKRNAGSKLVLTDLFLHL